MSIKRVFNGATIIKPGAWSDVKVQNLTGFPLQPTGIVGIVGEAIGGEPRVLDILESAQIQSAKDRYKSGPIADALGILADPTKDSRVANGASRIVVYKVNNGTRSAYELLNNAGSPVSILDLFSKNWGADENTLNIVVAEGNVVDAQAKLLGAIDGPFTVANAETLILEILGTTYTFTNTAVGSKTAAEMVIELNTGARWGGTSPVIATANGDKIDLELDPAVVAAGVLDYGYMYVDPASTIELILELTGTARGTKGSRFYTFVKGSSEEDALQELGGFDVLSIKYVGAGTDCKLSLQDVTGDKKLTSVCTGATADNLDITLAATEDGEMKPKITVKELVDVINGLAGYECSTTYANPDINAMELDYYVDLQIENVAGILKRDVYETFDYLNTYSQLVSAEAKSNVTGQIAVVASQEFFAGATDGTSANGDWGDGFDGLKEERINTLVPLISADKGSLSIESINALATSHVIAMTSTTGRSERNAILSYLGTKADLKEQARNTGTGLASMTGQDVQVFSHSQGKLAFLDPWAYACVCAGMQAGSPTGEPITHKLVNINDLRVRDLSWNPRTDYAEMIDAGVLFAEPLDTGGYRTVVGNTTYGRDANFVWNRMSVVEAGYYVAYDLRFNLEAIFTGTKAKTGSAEAIASLIKARMEVYLAADIIVGDDLNEGLGYKNLRVILEGNTALVYILVTPVQGIDFILPTIYLADILQSA